MQLPEYQPRARCFYIVASSALPNACFLSCKYLVHHFLGLVVSKIRTWQRSLKARIPKSCLTTSERLVMAASELCTMLATTSPMRWWPSKRCLMVANSPWKSGKTSSRRFVSCENSNIQIASITTDATSKNTQFGY